MLWIIEKEVDKMTYEGIALEKVYCCQLITFNKNGYGGVIDNRKVDCADFECAKCSWNLMNKEPSRFFGFRAEIWKFMKRFKNSYGEYNLLARWNEEKNCLELAEVPDSDCFEIKKC